MNPSEGQSKLVVITQDDWLYAGIASDSFIDEAQDIIAGATDAINQEVTHLAVMDNYSGENYLIISSKPLSDKSMRDPDGAGHYLTPSNDSMGVDNNAIYQCIPISAGGFHGSSANGSESDYSEEEMLEILKTNLQ
jgi:hypothetical protein